ncbi:MAG: hypothetical protein PUG09_02055 [Prevotella sp.]|nr:hypothetical protein [Prevotella sp.]
MGDRGRRRRRRKRIEHAVPIALTPQHTAVAQLLQPRIGLGRAELEFGSKGPAGDVAVLLEIVGEQD